MMNRVTIVGRLTRDPDLRYTPNGVAVANFTVASNRPFKNQQGEQEADFINCVAWRKPAENLSNYMKKGGLIGVDGRIQTRSYDGQDGKKVYVTEVLAENIQFLESRGGQGGGGQPQQPQQPQQYQQPQQPQYQQAPQQPQFSGGMDEQQINISDDDLPF